MDHLDVGGKTEGPSRVLIVSTCSSFGDYLGNLIEEAGCAFDLVATTQGAVLRLFTAAYQVVILADSPRGGIDCDMIFDHIETHLDGRVPLVLLSAALEFRPFGDFMERDLLAFTLPKPIGKRAFVTTLYKALRLHGILFLERCVPMAIEKGVAARTRALHEQVLELRYQLKWSGSRG